MVHQGLVRKIEVGSRSLQDTRFLHTEPHHDDLLLGYLPAIVRNVRSASNVHHFATLTSGFNAVTNRYMLGQLEGLKTSLYTPRFAELQGEGYFTPDNDHGRNRDVWQYLDGLAARNDEMRDKGPPAACCGTSSPSTTRAICGRSATASKSWSITSSPFIRARRTRGHSAAQGHVPGMGGRVPVGLFRLAVLEHPPLAAGLLHRRHLYRIAHRGPRRAADPAAAGADPPGRGFRGLGSGGQRPRHPLQGVQAVNAATQHYADKQGRRDIRIWGYRNVWYRFHPAEANIYVPVSLNMFSVMENAFHNTFVSQREASFPSYEHDGPFCELAQRIQVQQYQMLKTCLGREWFFEHPSPLIRCTRGFVFLREMDLAEFRQTARELRCAAEAV